MIATGGLMDAHSIAAARAAGAAAAMAGTAFMLAPEAATNPAHRALIGTDARTALTRAFTGRLARGIVNGFMTDHPDAPRAYPEIHHATAPLRAAARKAKDADGFNLWAGQGHALARERPAGEIVRVAVPPAVTHAAAAAAANSSRPPCQPLGEPTASRIASQPSPWRSRWRCSSSTRVRSGPSGMKRTSNSLVFATLSSCFHCSVMSQLTTMRFGPVEREHPAPVRLAAVDADAVRAAADLRLEHHLLQLGLADRVLSAATSCRCRR